MQQHQKCGNITIVAGKVISAMVVTAWQNRDVKNRKHIGDDCGKGLVFKTDRWDQHMLQLKVRSTHVSI
jgi:hypothetical protein